MELTTDDGQKIAISITPNHKVKTTSGWKQAQDIKAGDVIFLAKSSMERNTICTMEKGTSLEERKGYMSQSGSITTDWFLKGFIYTIKTKIRGIILSTILNVSMVANICLGILRRRCRMRNLLKNRESKWTMREYMQANGTEVKKELNGIESTGEKSQLTYNQENLHACIAEKSSGKSQLEVSNSALTSVSQHGEEGKDLTTKQESVKYAGKNLLLANTQKQEHVVPHVVASVVVTQKRQSEVYNLMIDEVHEYIADNLLVSNCMDAIRYSTMSDRAGRATKKRYTKDELNFGF
jgi:hypothetical protein